ncbi:MAG: hypothetical protein U0932_14555 [Thiobacillus sp.]|nr:hypothetical protein [Thiobacillus sp.]
MDTPTNEPTEIRAGDSVAWERALEDYSAADGWALKYRLLWATGTAVAITSTGSGTLHSVSLSAADTAPFAAGTATLVAYVEKGSGAALERKTLESNVIKVLPNLTTAPTHDGRSDNRIALEAARAALKSYMEKGQLHVAEYSIAGRVMKFRTPDEITTLIRYYEAEVAKEDRAAKGIRSNRILAVG